MCERKKDTLSLRFPVVGSFALESHDGKKKEKNGRSKIAHHKTRDENFVFSPRSVFGKGDFVSPVIRFLLLVRARRKVNIVQVEYSRETGGAQILRGT